MLLSLKIASVTFKTCSVIRNFNLCLKNFYKLACIHLIHSNPFWMWCQQTVYPSWSDSRVNMGIVQGTSNRYQQVLWFVRTICIKWWSLLTMVAVLSITSVAEPSCFSNDSRPSWNSFHHHCVIWLNITLSPYLWTNMFSSMFDFSMWVQNFKAMNYCSRQTSSGFDLSHFTALVHSMGLGISILTKGNLAISLCWLIAI